MKTEAQAQAQAQAQAINAARTVQPRISQYWSSHAEAYDAHQLEQLDSDIVRQTWIDIWKGALPTPPATVLDVGTGTGHVSLLLSDLGYQVTGIDLAEGMLDLARRKALAAANPPILQVGDAVHPPYPPSSFDVITARYVLWTLRSPSKALANWRRLLRPGGLLAAIDSTWYPQGVQAVDPAGESARQSDFRELYGDDVLAELPLAQATSIDETASRIERAGFTHVSVMPLHDVLELDRRFGVAPGHNVQMQFLITALAS